MKNVARFLVCVALTLLCGDCAAASGEAAQPQQPEESRPRVGSDWNGERGLAFEQQLESIQALLRSPATCADICVLSGGGGGLSSLIHCMIFSAGNALSHGLVPIQRPVYTSTTRYTPEPSNFHAFFDPWLEEARWKQLMQACDLDNIRLCPKGLFIDFARRSSLYTFSEQFGRLQSARLLLKTFARPNHSVLRLVDELRRVVGIPSHRPFVGVHMRFGDKTTADEYRKPVSPERYAHAAHLLGIRALGIRTIFCFTDSKVALRRFNDSLHRAVERQNAIAPHVRVVHCPHSWFADSTFANATVADLQHTNDEGRAFLANVLLLAEARLHIGGMFSNVNRLVYEYMAARLPLGVLPAYFDIAGETWFDGGGFSRYCSRHVCVLCARHSGRHSDCINGGKIC